MEYQARGHPPILVVLDADGEVTAGLDHGGPEGRAQAVPGHSRDRDCCHLTCEMDGLSGGLGDGGLVGGHYGCVLHQ